MRARISRNLWLLPALAAVVAAPGAAAPDSWPGLRGPDHAGGVLQASLFTGKETGLEIGWKRALGSGYSSVAVSGGKVVTMFADGEADVLAAFDTGSGEELWRYRVGDTYPGHDGSHDGPISTPLIGDGRVYGLGPRGHLFAVDLGTGEEIWAKDLVEDQQADPPYYGFGTTPALLDGVLVVEIGSPEGRAVAGFDAGTGEVRWTAIDDKIDYQSPIAAMIGGRMQVVLAGGSKLVGIDPKTGKVLWSYDHEGDGRAMSSASIIPVPVGDGRFLIKNKIDATTLVAVRPGKEVEYEVEPVWSTNVLKSSYVTPVYRDGYLYGMTGRIFTCVNAENGEIVWRSREPGDGFPTLVGDKLVILTKPGSLHVAEASPEGYRELARLDLFEEHSWSEVAFAGGHLYARSMGYLARIDPGMGAEPEAGPGWLASTEFGRFLARARASSDPQAVVDEYFSGIETTPIVEAPDVVHFVYQGDVEDVGIVGDIIGYRREDPMTRLPGTNLFYYSMMLEPTAATTYGFLPDYADEPVADPRNPDGADGLWGEVSFLAMPAWQPASSVLEPAPEGRRGRIRTFRWDSESGEDGTRVALVYLPAGYGDDPDRRYPVAYFHEGKDALELGQMKNVLDNLIGAAIEPIIGVFIMPDAKSRRELGDAKGYNERLVQELIPGIDREYRTIPEASARASVGSGDGAPPALIGAFQHADVFGRAACLSGTWFGAQERLRELLDGQPTRRLPIYLTWGTYDLRSPYEAWDMSVDSHEVWTMLREHGYRPAGGELPEGFGWDFWRAHAADALTALFPAPEAG
jgi:enterochelin esterase-like enzyme/outer membrane protein assembly factor BamB